MPVWLVRAGSKGEHENKFLADGRIYLTKRELHFDIAAVTEREALIEALKVKYGEDKPRRLTNYASQIWGFVHSMSTDDLIVLPAKIRSGIYLGRVLSDYQYDAQSEDPYLHCRQVEWIEKPIARAEFDKDLQQSFTASMTICQIKRNDAQARLEQMLL